MFYISIYQLSGSSSGAQKISLGLPVFADSSQADAILLLAMIS